MYTDLLESAPLFGICMVVAMFLSLGFMKALERYPLGTMKFIASLYLGFSLAFGGRIFYQYLIEPDSLILTYAIIVWVITGIAGLVIYCSQKKFKLVAMVIEATSEYLSDVQRIKLVPILSFLMIFGYLGLSGYAGLHLMSIGEVSFVNPHPFGKITRTDLDYSLIITTIASVLWTIFFIDHLGYFVMSAVASIWYFAPDRKALGSPIKTAFSWGIIYHCGSVAFGSFLLTTVWVLNKIVEAAEKSHEHHHHHPKNCA